jgi:hypothetical protein
LKKKIDKKYGTKEINYKRKDKSGGTYVHKLKIIFISDTQIVKDTYHKYFRECNGEYIKETFD